MTRAEFLPFERLLSRIHRYVDHIGKERALSTEVLLWFHNSTYDGSESEARASTDVGPQDILAFIIDCRSSFFFSDSYVFVTRFVSLAPPTPPAPRPRRAPSLPCHYNSQIAGL